MPPKKKSLKGGSTASDAVIKHVPDAAFEMMNRQFTNDFAISGGARRSKRAAPKVDLNASSSMRMVIRNKKGGANTYHASIGKPDVPPYKVPESLPSHSGNSILPSALTNWTQPAQTVPYPQLEIAARDTSSLSSVADKGPPQVGAGKAKSAKASAKSKSKTKSKSAKGKKH
jgi:hypothetical protein